MNKSGVRIESIDVFRAVTMFLMIFVNDLPTLNSYPKWLGHTTTFEDGMGFSDTIFPAFLFIVGLSIPFAVANRIKKGNDKIQILNHILKRSVSLIIMGFYAVNFENINNELLSYSKYVWELLMVLAFFLIWNHYREHKIYGKLPSYLLQVGGVLILGYLAYTYVGGSVDEPKGMRPYWWGILGLIGWAYLFCSLIYLTVRDNIKKIALFLGIFILMNISEFLLPELGIAKITVLESASHYTLVMGGVLTAIILKKTQREVRFLILVVVASAIAILLGFSIRPLWGISKNLATPSWTLITLGISGISFITFYLLCDKLKLTSLFKIIKPAGRSTLTAYLLPYYYYPLIALFGISYPEPLLSGTLGIIKCLVFSLFIIGVTKVLEMIKVRLKI